MLANQLNKPIKRMPSLYKQRRNKSLSVEKRLLLIMEQNIVGEWKDFHIRFVELTDIPNILLFKWEHGHDPLRDLAPVDEAYDAYMAPRLTAQMESEEVCPLSLIAIDKMTGEIAGIHLQFIWRKEDAFRPTNRVGNIPHFRKIMDSMHAKLSDSKLGMFGKYGVESVVWNFVVAVNTKHRGKGLASEMYSRVVRLLRSKKMTVAFSVFTSPFSRRAAEKAGFVEIDRAYFNELTDEHGVAFLPHATQNDFASVMVLRM